VDPNSPSQSECDQNPVPACSLNPHTHGPHKIPRRASQSIPFITGVPAGAPNSSDLCRSQTSHPDSCDIEPSEEGGSDGLLRPQRTSADISYSDSGSCLPWQVGVRIGYRCQVRSSVVTCSSLPENRVQLHTGAPACLIELSTVHRAAPPRSQPHRRVPRHRLTGALHGALLVHLNSTNGNIRQQDTTPGGDLGRP
jgi:hypothetical protein